MSECNIDIKMGVDGNEGKDKYRVIDVHVEMHQEKVCFFVCS